MAGAGLGLAPARLPSRDRHETLSDQAPECGAGVKPEGGPHAILHVLRRVLEADDGEPGRGQPARGEPGVRSGAALCGRDLSPGVSGGQENGCVLVP